MKLCTVIKCQSKILFRKRNTHTQADKKIFSKSLLSHTKACSSDKYIHPLFDEWSSGLLYLIGFVWFQKYIVWNKKNKKKSKRNILYSYELVCFCVCICVCYNKLCTDLCTTKLASPHSCTELHPWPKQNFSWSTHTNTHHNNTSVRSLFFSTLTGQ